MFENARQQQTTVGTFESLNWSTRTMHYTNGEFCSNINAARTMNVKLECGASTELVDVTEPSTCHYEARLLTPSACEQADLETAQKELRKQTELIKQGAI